MAANRIYSIGFDVVYPAYIKKAEKKQRTKEEVDEIICWLTGYSREDLQRHVGGKSELKTFFDYAPRINPDISLIKGTVCGIRVEEIDDPLVHKIRCMDKMIDELAKGKSMNKILRKG